MESAQIIEIVIPVEKLGGIISLAKGELRPDITRVRPGDVIGDKVNDGLEAMRIDAFQEVAEFIQPFFRVIGVIRANIKVVPDGIGRAGLALDQDGLVGRAPGVGS